jgi:hypothetical protein
MQGWQQEAQGLQQAVQAAQAQEGQLQGQLQQREQQLAAMEGVWLVAGYCGCGELSTTQGFSSIGVAA